MWLIAKIADNKIAGAGQLPLFFLSLFADFHPLMTSITF
jgi:hypothetical protein